LRMTLVLLSLFIYRLTLTKGLLADIIKKILFTKWIQ